MRTRDPAQFSLALQSSRDVHRKGKNVLEFLRNNFDLNREDAIEISYSLQSGAYTAFARDSRSTRFHQEIHEIIKANASDMSRASVLDFGIGEGTAWIRANAARPRQLFGIDISNRRLQWCRKNITGVRNLCLVRSDAAFIPLADQSMDIVTTMHAIEPNGDERAARIIRELARVCRGTLMLFEPNYHTANEAMRERMDTHGYNKVCWPVAHDLEAFEVVHDAQLRNHVSELNRTSCLILRRTARTDTIRQKGSPLICPITRSRVNKKAGFLLDESESFAYPIFEGVNFFNRTDALFVDNADL
jgi:2-polyprenyl-3-methyl-5-hydroxy-6-metoxy-1,4-benzoquinol methylase